MYPSSRDLEITEQGIYYYLIIPPTVGLPGDPKESCNNAMHVYLLICMGICWVGVVIDVVWCYEGCDECMYVKSSEFVQQLLDVLSNWSRCCIVMCSVSADIHIRVFVCLSSPRKGRT